MRTINAKFDSSCRKCGAPIEKGDEAVYDDAQRKIYCLQCRPAEQLDLDTGASELAERLGYEPGCETIRADWFLWDLRQGH